MMSKRTNERENPLKQASFSKQEKFKARLKREWLQRKAWYLFNDFCFLHAIKYQIHLNIPLKQLKDCHDYPWVRLTVVLDLYDLSKPRYFRIIQVIQLIICGGWAPEILGRQRVQSVSSVTQSCPTLCNPMSRSMPGLPVPHQLPELTQTHVHRVSDAIQPSHPLSSPSPPATNPSQHQGFFQWVNSSHEVAKVLEFQLQHQSF